MKKLISLAVILIFSTIAHSGIGKGAFGGDTSFSRYVSASSEAPFVEPDPVYDFQPFASNGTSLLSSTLVINGTTLDLVVSCVGSSQITGASACDTGGTVVTTGTGSDPTTSTLVPFTDGSSAGVFAASQKRVQFSNTSTGDFPTDDFVVELVYQSSTTTVPLVAKDSSVAAGTPGWQIRAESGGTVIGVSDGATYTSASVNQSGASWNYVMAFHDNSGNLMVTSNGTAGTPVAVSARGSLTTTTSLSFGGNAAGNMTGKIALVRIWKCTDCLLSDSDNTTVAKNRSDIIWGLKPAVGTAVASTYIGSNASYTAIGDSSGLNKALYRTTANLPKVTRGKFYGSSTVVTGVFTHEASTNNRALQNLTLDNASWTKLNSTVTANNAASPTGDTDADTVVDNATSGLHCITQDMVLTAVPWTISVYADKGTLDFLYIDVSTLSNVSAYYNINTGTVGTVGSSATAFIDPGYLNLPYRSELRFTGTAATHTIRFCSATANGTNSYSGGSGTIDLWGVQVQAAPVATPLIATTTSAVSSSSSALYTANAIDVSVVTGSIRSVVFCPTGGQTGTNTNLFSYRLAGTSDVDLNLGSDGGLGYLGVDSVGTVWDITSSEVAIRGSSQHSVFAVNNGLEVWLGADSSVLVADFIPRTMPAITTHVMGINSNEVGGSAPNCIVSRFSLYDAILTPRPVAIGAIGGSNSATDYSSVNRYPEQLANGNGYLLINAATPSALASDVYTTQYVGAINAKVTAPQRKQE